MSIEESNQDSQSKGRASRKESFPNYSHDYVIDASPFIRNVVSNSMYPGEWFELEAENSSGYITDSIFSGNSSRLYIEYVQGINELRRVLRQEDANNIKPNRKGKVFRGTILIVSKDPVFLNSLNSIFGDLGYHMVPAEVYGYRLIEVLDRITPNLAIIDIGMPSMTGVETTLLVRIHTAIPTILLTKWQTDGNTFRKLDVESPDALSKPITSDELVKLVNSVKIRHEDINM